MFARFARFARGPTLIWFFVAIAFAIGFGLLGLFAVHNDQSTVTVSQVTTIVSPATAGLSGTLPSYESFGSQMNWIAVASGAGILALVVFAIGSQAFKGVISTRRDVFARARLILLDCPI